MSDDEKLLARLEERIAALISRVDKLEKAQWFVVVTVIGFVIQQVLKVLAP